MRVDDVRVTGKHQLLLTFEDGTRGYVDLADRLHGPMFEPLRDPAEFKKAFVDEFGSVCWPNGADLSGEMLYGLRKKP